MTTTLETRVTNLERDMAVLKGKTETIDADKQTLPGLINTHFRFVDSQFARVRAEIADMHKEIGDMHREIGGMKLYSEDRFDAVLRAIAEALAERRSPG